MVDNISFEERGARLKRLTQGAQHLNDEALVQVLAISNNARNRIRTALNVYLWTCLNAAFEDKSFLLSDDMLRDHEQEILKLPNVTPNGLVLPKRENMLAFNLLQKEASAAFHALGFGNRIARIQYPINVRLQSGIPAPAIDNRPRASVKPHTDIWAGEPAAGALVFLSVLGDPNKAGIRFFEPYEFPASFVRTLEDYNEGIALMESAKELSSFDERGWFIADSYLIHQTTKRGSGSRISIDFRIIPTERVSSDIDEDATRKPFFMPFDEWMKLGNSIWITTQEGIKEFSAERKQDPYTTGYPGKISLTTHMQETLMSAA